MRKNSVLFHSEKGESVLETRKKRFEIFGKANDQVCFLGLKGFMQKLLVLSIRGSKDTQRIFLEAVSDYYFIKRNFVTSLESLSDNKETIMIIFRL